MSNGKRISQWQLTHTHIHVSLVLPMSRNSDLTVGSKCLHVFNQSEEMCTKYTEVKELTVQTNVAFRVADGVFGDTFIASKIGFSEISNGETHLYAVVGAVDFGHVVLVVGNYHLTCNKDIK